MPLLQQKSDERPLIRIVESPEQAHPFPFPDIEKLIDINISGEEEYRKVNKKMFGELVDKKQVIIAAKGCHLLMIEHIGSTAVPGLAAKPVIDIAVGIHKLEVASFLIPRIES